jgi:hypothetical protein
MATITPVKPLEASNAVPFAATVSGGDEVACPVKSDDYLIEFHNTHASPVTFTITPAAAFNIAGYGNVSKAAITEAVPASAHRSVLIPASILAHYINAAGRIPVTYTSHNVAFLIRAQQIPN